jgi:hypothetical protein
MTNPTNPAPESAGGEKIGHECSDECGCEVCHCPIAVAVDNALRTPDGSPRWARCRRCGHEYFPFHEYGKCAFHFSTESTCPCGGWDGTGSYVTDVEIAALRTPAAPQPETEGMTERAEAHRLLDELIGYFATLAQHAEAGDREALIALITSTDATSLTDRLVHAARVAADAKFAAAKERGGIA